MSISVFELAEAVETHLPALRSFGFTPTPPYRWHFSPPLVLYESDDAMLIVGVVQGTLRLRLGPRRVRFRNLAARDISEAIGRGPHRDRTTRIDRSDEDDLETTLRGLDADLQQRRQRLALQSLELESLLEVFRRYRRRWLPYRQYLVELWTKEQRWRYLLHVLNLIERSGVIELTTQEQELRQLAADRLAQAAASTPTAPSKGATARAWLAERVSEVSASWARLAAIRREHPFHPDFRDLVGAYGDARDVVWDWLFGGSTRHLRDDNTDDTERAIVWMEVNPYLHGSGHYKDRLNRYLRRQPLTDAQQQRLRHTLLNAVGTPAGREFRDSCRLARKLDDPTLREGLVERLSSPQAGIRIHALMMLSHLAWQGIDPSALARAQAVLLDAARAVEPPAVLTEAWTDRRFAERAHFVARLAEALWCPALETLLVGAAEAGDTVPLRLIGRTRQVKFSAGACERLRAVMLRMVERGEYDWHMDGVWWRIADAALVTRLRELAEVEDDLQQAHKQALLAATERRQQYWPFSSRRIRQRRYRAMARERAVYESLQPDLQEDWSTVPMPERFTRRL